MRTVPADPQSRYCGNFHRQRKLNKLCWRTNCKFLQQLNCSHTFLCSGFWLLQSLTVKTFPRGWGALLLKKSTYLVLAFAALSLTGHAGSQAPNPATTRSPHGPLSVPCQNCHTLSGWKPIRAVPEFDHNTTRYPLRGMHQNVGCTQCHTKMVFTNVGTNCAACHADIHRGQLGADCEQC